ncbi:SAF domain-containing protein [Frankia sp. Cr1]|uniref:SAF domain-containing protein n=1 Tax=Frankia sp. Cr1 TaxID=3073931 RepID=UPI002AD2A853|nr:SAF domain-containing protein [Frankia sp. Cr1]
MSTTTPGWRPETVGVEDPPGRSRPSPRSRQTPSVSRSRRSANAAFALLLMIAGAGGAVWFAADNQPQLDVVALARPLSRGQVVTPADLAVIRITAQGGAARLTTPQVARQALVGKPLLLDLPAGTLVTPEMVGSVAPPDGYVALGVRVAADALPSATLRPGEHVDILGFDKGTGVASVLVRDFTVTEINRPGPDGRAGDSVVFLMVPEQTAGAVATAAVSDRGVRLLGGRR